MSGTTRTKYTGIHSYQTKKGQRYAAVASLKGHQRWRRGYTDIPSARAAYQELLTEMRMTLPRKRVAIIDTRERKRAAFPDKNGLGAFLVEEGWRPGSSEENRVCATFALLGLKPHQIEQQFRLGPYHIDFAMPSDRVAIEVDGPYHLFPTTKTNDVRRDAAMKRWGWTIHRLDTGAMTDEEIRTKLVVILASC